MLVAQLNVLFPVIAVFLVLAVFVLYVYYTTDRHYRIKLLLGPALLGASVFVAPLVGAKLGYAWATPLPPSFQYIAHRTVVVDGEKRWIDVMLMSRKPLARDARLHRVPWTRPVEKALEQAQGMKEGPGGGEIVVNGPSGNGGEPDAYSVARVLPQDEVRKGEPPAPRVPRVPPQQLTPQPKEPPRYVT